MYRARFTLVRAYRAYRISNYPRNKQAIRCTGTLGIETTYRICSTVSRTHTRGDTSSRVCDVWRGGEGGGGKRSRYLARTMCVYACNVARTHALARI